MEQAIDASRIARLRWRARRGLLENDLLLTRFFARYETQLTDTDAAALTQLLELDDNELMDLLLSRAEPQGSLAAPAIQHLLGKLRSV
jgi:antitoxin CptB